MGKRRTKNTDASNASPFAAGNAATAVMERRRAGSKSSQLDWIHLVNGQRLGENISPSIVGEVADACDLADDSWALFMGDVKDLSNYLRQKRYADKAAPFIEEHGTMEDLCNQQKELKEQLKAVETLIKDLRINRNIDNAVNGPALSAVNGNKRLFPNKNDTLLQEAGIT
jgi:hypothetical protein